MSFRVLIMLAGAAIAFGGGWAVNGWRLGERIQRIHVDHARAELSAALDAGIRTAELAKQVEDARNEATKREIDNRRAADGARNANERLRDELAELRRSLPDLSTDAVRERADTLAELFAECTARYSGLAEKADRHASDVRTLSDASPK